jgi:hypothetical protein
MGSFMSYISTLNKNRVMKIFTILFIVIAILYICIQISIYILSYGINTFSNITDAKTSIGLQTIIFPILISVASVVLYPIIYLYNYIRPCVNMVIDSIIQILLRKYCFVYESTNDKINSERNNMIMQSIYEQSPYAGKYHLTDNNIKFPVGLIYDTNWVWFAFISIKQDYDDTLYDISIYAFDEKDVTKLISNNLCKNTYTPKRKTNRILSDDLSDDSDNNDIYDIDTNNEYIELCQTSPYINAVMKPMNFIYTLIKTEEQTNVMNSIIQLVEARYRNIKTYNASILLHGIPGTGKSAIGIMLAYKLKGIVCTTYSPFKTGNRIERIIKSYKPTKNNPLIIVINELYEQLTDTIHSDNINLNKRSVSGNDITAEIYNKTTFNNWMDSLCKYNYVIIIFTSNIGIDKYNELDTSYMRRGRIHKVFELTDNSTINNILDRQEYINFDTNKED